MTSYDFSSIDEYKAYLKTLTFEEKIQEAKRMGVI